MHFDKHLYNAVFFLAIATSVGSIGGWLYGGFNYAMFIFVIGSGMAIISAALQKIMVRYMNYRRKKYEDVDYDEVIDNLEEDQAD